MQLLGPHRAFISRDTWRLFLRFVSQRRNRAFAQLDLQHLTAGDVLAFLQYVEDERKDSVGTRNCRLAALHSFFAYVVDRDPTIAGQCAEILRIPKKRTTERAIDSLDLDELNAILSQPDQKTYEGQRDHALLYFLYNTGARIQEALDVCPNALRLDAPAHVRLRGKGNKERFCPLWCETADLLRALLVRHPRLDDEQIFVNRYGLPLGASGVRFKLAQYVTAAARQIPSLKAKNVTPHRFRHTMAVHLIAAGNDVTVIRSWRGHAHLDTTSHYSQVSLEIKRRILEEVHLSPTGKKRPPWENNADLLAWLDSL
ncbi:tyrosine-type recombinase/integrase [Paraburkholderia caribensis]|uniref:Tyrosine-type recombinase/integrase n=2 Tax=Paraburkholderia caribensis TaxID=75105 RepID=A0ABV0EAX1_9BURK|nr:tyrosine-type recombinase/integrase [Paraburkholderia caribensis]